MQDIIDDPQLIFESCQDLERIPQDEGNVVLASIAYTEEYKTAMEYCRTLMKLNEISERALNVTLFIISKNPAHYSIWEYRRQILKGLLSLSSKTHDDENQNQTSSASSELDSLMDELEILTEIMEENPKNYQLWHHRQWILQNESVPESIEFAFLDAILTDDSKNYHAWSYRQWLSKHFINWSRELKFTDKSIQEDVRNNSAWNHRMFTVQNLILPLNSNNQENETLEMYQTEMEYVLRMLDIVFKNEAAWVFLTELLSRTPAQSQKDHYLSLIQTKLLDKIQTSTSFMIPDSCALLFLKFPSLLKNEKLKEHLPSNSTIFKFVLNSVVH